MNKSEWMWVAIRFAGLYFLVMAVIAIPEAISNLYAANLYAGLELSSENDMQKMLTNLQKTYSVNALKSTVQSILYSITSYYLIRRGRLLHNILSKDENA